MEELKIEELDLYEVLEVDSSCSVIDIKKAYRKKALQCHPDKNPDDPDAAKKFHELSKILEILTDETARNAYDKVLKGRKEASIRHKELDGKRRKLKEDLEFREKVFTSQKTREKTADQKLKEEIERLRKEGSRQVEEEVEYVLKKIRDEKQDQHYSEGSYRIKIKWKSDKHDPQNGGYTQEILQKFLSKYGDVQALVLSSKKHGSALVEFKQKSAASMAVELEVGLPSNPLKLEWLNGPPSTSKPTSALIKDSDFESVTLMKLRQAEERKKLIAQMMAEDEES